MSTIKANDAVKDAPRSLVNIFSYACIMHHSHVAHTTSTSSGSRAQDGRLLPKPDQTEEHRF